MKTFSKQFPFSKILLDWYDPDLRPMPWKAEKDPYLVWLSEIILQQTRVEQGLPYFNKFKQHYPTVNDLADAPEDELMKLWEGLGYYSRARNLHFSAKYIANELNGHFPSDYTSILKLKGVGPYTAAAIVSFAFNLPKAVVDGNVFRVLSRIFGIEDPIDSTTGKKKFEALANELLDKNDPAIYNQAIIDFGAIQCSPKSPDCESCPFQEHCFAFQNEQVNDFPVKAKKLTRKTRFFYYLVLNQQDKVLIRKRIKKDIWRNLYEFPLIETQDLISMQDLSKMPAFLNYVGNDFEFLHFSKPIKQNLTHQKIISRFVELKVKNNVFDKNVDYKIVSQKDLNKFAFSKNIDWYLKDKSLYLESTLF